MAVESVRYWWFERKSAVALAFRILRAVIVGRFARLEVIPYEKDGLSALRFRVVKKGDDARLAAGLVVNAPNDINESHICPPDCGGGGG